MLAAGAVCFSSETDFVVLTAADFAAADFSVEAFEAVFEEDRDFVSSVAGCFSVDAFAAGADFTVRTYLSATELDFRVPVVSPTGFFVDFSV